MNIEIYHDPETDLWTVTVTGSDDWDQSCDMTEQQARDEAEAISAETNAPIVYT